MHTVRMRHITLIVVVGLIGLAGCVVSSRPSAIGREELVGNYEVTLPFGHGSLRLRSDGRYTQDVEIGGERV